MPGRRTRNNSSVLIESIRLKTCLFIPARVRPSPTQNAPFPLSCAFRVQTEHCILFHEKKNFCNIDSRLVRPSLYTYNIYIFF